MLGPVISEALTDIGPDSLNKDVVRCLLVADISHFSRPSIQIVGVVYGRCDGLVFVAQNCRAHLGNSPNVSNFLNK